VSNLIVSLDTPTSAPSSNKRPPLTWRKLRRKMIKKLLKTINVIRGEDGKADLQAAVAGVPPLLFVGTFGSGADNALTTIQRKAEACLLARG
jgi:hypothetical protein